MTSLLYAFLEKYSAYNLKKKIGKIDSRAALGTNFVTFKNQCGSITFLGVSHRVPENSAFFNVKFAESFDKTLQLKSCFFL